MGPRKLLTGIDLGIRARLGCAHASGGCTRPADVEVEERPGCFVFWCADHAPAEFPHVDDMPAPKAAPELSPRDWLVIGAARLRGMAIALEDGTRELEPEDGRFLKDLSARIVAFLSNGGSR